MMNLFKNLKIWNIQKAKNNIYRQGSTTSVALKKQTKTKWIKDIFFDGCIERIFGEKTNKWTTSQYSGLKQCKMF